MFKLLALLLTTYITLSLTATPLTTDYIKPHSTPAVSRGTTPQASKILTLQATAYTHTGYQTATGTWPKEGRTIAVDPSTIPLGSRVYIEGLGWRIAEDKLPPESIRKGAKVDVFVDSHEQAVNFGRQNIVVQIENRR